MPFTITIISYTYTENIIYIIFYNLYLILNVFSECINNIIVNTLKCHNLKILSQQILIIISKLYND